MPPQFRQAVTILMRIFEAMQREQLDLIRHELARVQQTLELAAPVETSSNTSDEGTDTAPASPPSPPLILPTLPPQATPKLDLFERAEALRTLQTPAWRKLVEALTGGNLGRTSPLRPGHTPISGGCTEAATEVDQRPSGQARRRMVAADGNKRRSSVAFLPRTVNLPRPRWQNGL